MESKNTTASTFALEVRVTDEAVNDDGLVPCDTSDGCGTTCASACTNSGL